MSKAIMQIQASLVDSRIQLTIKNMTGKEITFKTGPINTLAVASHTIGPRETRRFIEVGGFRFTEVDL